MKCPFNKDCVRLRSFDFISGLAIITLTIFCIFQSFEIKNLMHLINLKQAPSHSALFFTGNLPYISANGVSLINVNGKAIEKEPPANEIMKAVSTNKRRNG